MNVLCIGDVCGNIGCNMVKENLSDLKRKYSVDLTIANGENSADGNGITPYSAETLFNYGVDIITGGNHSMRRKEVYDLLEENLCILRPDNLNNAEYGSGYCLFDMGRLSVAVINLSGKMFLDNLEVENPFTAADSLIERAKSDNAGIIIVDFHAEATSEKRAFGFYLDGRVSAVFGTHTHVQTADEQILPDGTAYITDLGMTGPLQSVLGVKKEIIINRLRSNDMSKFELADGECILNACIFKINEKSGLSLGVERINIK